MKQPELRLPPGKSKSQQHWEAHQEAEQGRKAERRRLANLALHEVVDWPDDPTPFDQLKDDSPCSI